MPNAPNVPVAIDVYLERGSRRAFAGAIEWPGWCRAGRDEGAALEALAAYARRYRAAMGRAARGFRAPADAAAFAVVEQLKGDATTDFGAPSAAPEADGRPLDRVELERQSGLLRAAWRALDRAAEAAAGATLRKGPRGGGRDLPDIVRHVMEAERGYLSVLGGSFRLDRGAEGTALAAGVRAAILDTLGARSRGELPARGPRGGARWTPRYFLRRATWHVLDHVWEIEDRAALEPV